MALPIQYNLRNLLARKVSTWMTLLGITMVVLMFCVIQALSQGMAKVFVSSGTPENLVLLRPGAIAEVQSQITRDAFRVVSSYPEIARDEKGPLCSAERFAVVYVPRPSTGGRTNLAVRGATERSFAVRPNIKLVEGRLFQPGLQEIVVGKGAQKRFSQLQIGSSISFEGRNWKVVGVFDAGSQAYDSEVWADLEDIGSAFKRPEYNSVIARTVDTSTRDLLAEKLKSDTQLKLNSFPEPKYFSEQTKAVPSLEIVGQIILVLLSIGATFGAMNTMYSAVSTRTREIAVLRAIGFGKGSVLAAFLLESIFLCLIGGAIGCAGSLFFNGMQSGTMNWATFTEVAFQFQVTPQILMSGLIFAGFLGLVGGLFPALRAARMSIVGALRAV